MSKGSKVWDRMFYFIRITTDHTSPRENHIKNHYLYWTEENLVSGVEQKTLNKRPI